MEFSALILAGGKSSRMGINKALAEYRGQSLLQYPLSLASRFTGKIMISANSDEFHDTGYPVIPDILTAGAPVAGIHAGLTHSATPWLLVLGCDMPHLSVALIRLLLHHLPDDQPLLVPVHHGFAEPLCGFYHRDLLPILSDRIRNQQLTLLDLIMPFPQRQLPVNDIDGIPATQLFKNMNRPEDLY